MGAQADGGVGPARTGITAANLGRLRMRVVHLGGTVDSAPIELHGISVRGRRRDVAVVTTTYGRTIAIDPGTGQHLWQFTPGDIRSYQGTAQVTTATPVADPDRRYVYATSPDGYIHKLSLSTGREVRSGHWPARITFDPTHEKLPAALNISGGSVLVTTGGYIADIPPYQGHVVLIDRISGAVAHVFNTLCSNRHYLVDPPSSCPASDSAIWARAGAVIEPGSRDIVVATGLLYVYDENGGALEVYAPATGRRLASLRAQSGHRNSPIVAGGRIILPVGSYHSQSTQGTLLIYHLPGR